MENGDKMPRSRISDTNSFNHILITGASGGLGAAIAQHYAAPGRILTLWGRDQARLEHVAETCRRSGAEARIRSIDLLDSAAAVSAIVEDDADVPIDLLLLAAGLGDIRGFDDVAESAAQVIRLCTVNFVSPAAIAAALATRMAARQRGQIVLIGSAAAFHALPFAASYAASKAGLERFAHALRISVAKHHVYLTLVSPGFINTAAGRKTPGPKPFLLQPHAVARRIATATERRQAHLILPWPFAALRVLDHILPRPIRDRLLNGLTPRSVERP